MNENTENSTGPSADFLKTWSEAFSRILQAAAAYTPDKMPPEMLRQIRSGVFQAIAQSWEEYMRSPQFLEGMKQMMDNAIAFRKLSADLFSRAQEEMQPTGRHDTGEVLSAMREMEARLTKRMEELTGQLGRSQDRLGRLEKHRKSAAAKSTAKAAKRPPRRAKRAR